ncbi:MAG: UPF0182 family protein, partial [Actinomycetota bacterium]
FESDPLVSSQLSLLRQGGSQVELGNLLSLPFNGGLLYVEPVYIRASQEGYPLFRKVLVGYGSNVSMENSLDLALAKVFGKSPSSTTDQLPDPNAPSGQGESSASPSPSPSGTTSPETALAEALILAQSAYDDGQLALAKGDFAAYGQAMEQLKAALDAAAAAEAQMNPDLLPTQQATPSASPGPSTAAA